MNRAARTAWWGLAAAAFISRAYLARASNPGVDEIFSLFYSHRSFVDIWRSLRETNVHPMGYFYYLKAWRTLGSVFSVDDWMWLSNLPPLFVGVWAMGKIFDEWQITPSVRLLALLMFLTNVKLAFTATELRPYTWVLAGTLAGIYAAEKKYVVRWGLAAAGVISCHYYAVFAVAPQIFLLPRNLRIRGAAWAGVFAAPALALLFYFPKYRYLPDGSFLRLFSPHEMGQLISMLTLPSLFTTKLNAGRALEWTTYATTLAILLCRRGPDARARFLILAPAFSLSVLAIAAFFNRPAFLPRYFLPLASYAVLLVAHALSRDFPHRRAVTAGWAGLVILNAAFFAQAGYARYRAYARPNVFPTPRMAALRASSPAPAAFDGACPKRAVFSNDHVALEFLASFCPDEFRRVKRADALARAPEVFSAVAAPARVLLYQSDAISRKLYGSADEFYRRRADGAGEYSRIPSGLPDYEVWVLTKVN